MLEGGVVPLFYLNLLSVDGIVRFRFIYLRMMPSVLYLRTVSFRFCCDFICLSVKRSIQFRYCAF